MKTFTKFKEQIQLNERFLTIADCRKAYAEGVANGTIRICEKCGSPNLFEIEKFGMSCVDCGNKTNGVVPKLKEDSIPRLCKKCQSPNIVDQKCTECGTLNEDEFQEDAPTNNAGSGNIAGIGVGAQGEPGVSPEYQRKRKQLKLMNGPAVDPRMFADKIFSRKPPVK